MNKYVCASKQHVKLFYLFHFLNFYVMTSDSIPTSTTSPQQYICICWSTSLPTFVIVQHFNLCNSGEYKIVVYFLICIFIFKLKCNFGFNLHFYNYNEVKLIFIDLLAIYVSVIQILFHCMVVFFFFNLRVVCILWINPLSVIYISSF